MVYCASVKMLKEELLFHVSKSLGTRVFVGNPAMLPAVYEYLRMRNGVHKLHLLFYFFHKVVVLL